MAFYENGSSGHESDTSYATSDNESEQVKEPQKDLELLPKEKNSSVQSGKRKRKAPAKISNGDYIPSFSREEERLKKSKFTLICFIFLEGSFTLFICS